MLNKPLVKECIEQAWNSVSLNNGGLISERIRDCRRVLSKWKKVNNNNSLDNIHHLQVALEREQSFLRPNLFQTNKLKRELLQAYKEEESYWKEKSRNN